MGHSNLDKFFAEPAELWIESLPKYQQSIIYELQKSDVDFLNMAQSWINATTENTYKFGTTNSVGDKSTFLKNVKKEIRLFLCGDDKYKEQREGLFGSNSTMRTYVVGVISVAIAPYLGVAAAALSPLVALILASLCGITLNAWCATED